MGRGFIPGTQDEAARGICYVNRLEVNLRNANYPQLSAAIVKSALSANWAVKERLATSVIRRLEY